MRKKVSLYKGILIMLISASAACLGQLFWKLAAKEDQFLFLCVGLFLYGMGAVLMILALRYGELSILHPMMSSGYVLSLILGAAVLREEISLQRIVGIAVIILGMVLLSVPEVKRKR